MVLAVDIGNTTISVGCFEKDGIQFVESISTNKNSTALEYTVLIKTVLELNGMSGQTFQGGIISSVVPSVTNPVRDAVIKLTGKPVMIVGPGIKTGLKINLDNPAQLGSDIAANAVAAVNNYPCPLIIVDMGTATTVSVIGSNRSYLGGMIIPGIGVSLNSLSSSASQLPHISPDRPKKVIGTNTIDCMKSGIVYGAAAQIDGVADRIESELEEKCTVIATGDLAESIIPLCRRDIIVDDNLLLKGLMIIYNKNAQ